MRLPIGMNEFSLQPCRSLVLALLLLLMAILFLSGWPLPATKYFAHNEGLAAGFFVGFALFLDIRELIGFRKHGNRGST